MSLQETGTDRIANGIEWEMERPHLQDGMRILQNHTEPIVQLHPMVGRMIRLTLPRPLQEHVVVKWVARQMDDLIAPSPLPYPKRNIIARGLLR